MSETIQGAWIQVAGGVIIAFITLIGAITLFYIGRIYERRDRNRQKIIETIKEATPIVIPEEANLLTVAIDRSFLTNKDEDKGKTERVESAYSFFITVINSGTETIEHPEIDITIDEDSRIVQISVVSETIPEEKIISERPYPNKIRVTPKYFNSGTSIKISILSINNKQNTCKVLASGPGVSHKEKALDAHSIQLSLSEAVLLGLLESISLIPITRYIYTSRRLIRK